MAAAWEAERISKSCTNQSELCRRIAVLHVEHLVGVVHAFLVAFAEGILGCDSTVISIMPVAHKLTTVLNDVLQVKFRAQTQDLHYEHDVHFVPAKYDLYPKDDRLCMRTPIYTRLENDPRNGKYATQPVIAKEAGYFTRQDIGLPSVSKAIAGRTSSRTSDHTGV